MKQSNCCGAYSSRLTQDKELEVVDFQDTYKLIQLIDRGSLKWPSHIVIDVIIVVWKICHDSERYISYASIFIRTLTEDFDPTHNNVH